MIRLAFLGLGIAAMLCLIWEASKVQPARAAECYAEDAYLEDTSQIGIRASDPIKVTMGDRLDLRLASEGIIVSNYETIRVMRGGGIEAIAFFKGGCFIASWRRPVGTPA